MPDHKEQDNTQQQLFVDNPLSDEARSHDPKAFVAHLREEIRQATRMVMEEIMREELTHFVGAEWGESSPTRTGYRNGYYTQDLQTTNARIEDLQVPRDRDGAFHTQLFERYSRYEPHIAEGLTEMFVSGTSTEKVGNVAKTLLGITPSSSTISRLNHGLTEQYEAWRERALQTHYRVLYLDGVYFTVRHGEKTDSTVLLTALGVDLDGKREVLALRTGAEESKDGWGCLLNDLRTRGVQTIDLIVTDGHEGLLAALREQFPATPRQRCVIHKQRNMMNAIPKREQAY